MIGRNMIGGNNAMVIDDGVARVRMDARQPSDPVHSRINSVFQKWTNNPHESEFRNAFLWG